MASRDLNDAVPELQVKVPLIIADYVAQFPDRDLRVICTLRTTTEQQQLYARGRSFPPYGRDYQVTDVDGVTKFSKHNPDPVEPKSKAVDFGVFIVKKYITNETYYYPLLDLARKYNLVSGGDFHLTGLPLDQVLKLEGFKDWPHVEVTGALYVPPQQGS